MDDKSERWKPLPSFEGRYEVSNKGAVRSLFHAGRAREKRRTVPKIMKPHGDPYKRVTISAGGRSSQLYIHRLVAEAFIGPPPDGFHCAHLNGDPADNRLSNLAWVSPAENERHKLAHGTALIGEKCVRAKLTETAVKDIRANYHKLGPLALGRKYRVHCRTVWAVATGETWRHVQ